MRNLSKGLSTNDGPSYSHQRETIPQAPTSPQGTSLLLYSPWGCKELDTTERISFVFFFFVLFLFFLINCVLRIILCRKLF